MTTSAEQGRFLNDRLTPQRQFVAANIHFGGRSPPFWSVETNFGGSSIADRSTAETTIRNDHPIGEWLPPWHRGVSLTVEIERGRRLQSGIWHRDSNRMRDLLRHLIEALEQDRELIVCQVVETRGSTPQKAGSMMIIDPDGGQMGTLGGHPANRRRVRRRSFVCPRP
jgi:hypothetical protein